MTIQDERKNAEEWLKIVADYLLARDDIKGLLEKENKSLKKCGQYILQEARKKGSYVAMTDKEVFGLAVHYYDEDDITVKHTSKADVKAAAQKDDKPLKPLDEYRKDVEQKEPADIDKMVEERVSQKLAEIKKAEQEKKEKRKAERAERKAKKSKFNQVSLFDL